MPAPTFYKSYGSPRVFQYDNRSSQSFSLQSIDHLDRNHIKIQESWWIMTKGKGQVSLSWICFCRDTHREKDLMGTFLSNIVLSLLSYIADNERVNIWKRQAEDITAAKAKEIRLGKLHLSLPNNFYTFYNEWNTKKISLAKASKKCGLSKICMSYLYQISLQTLYFCKSKKKG